MGDLVPTALLLARLRRHGSNFDSHGLFLTIVFRSWRGPSTRLLWRLGLRTVVSPRNFLRVLNPNLLILCACVQIEVQRVSDNVVPAAGKRLKMVQEAEFSWTYARGGR